MQYVKAVAAALASFVSLVIVVWADKSISLDEMNALWLALVPALTAVGVIAAPKNQTPT